MSNLIPHSKVHLIIESCKNAPTLSELYEKNCKTSSVKCYGNVKAQLKESETSFNKYETNKSNNKYVYFSRCLFCNYFRRARSMSANFYTIQLSNEPWNGELNLTCFSPRNLNIQCRDLDPFIDN